MGLAGAGALAGLGEGMGKMGQTILQATLGNEQLKQNNKWLEADMFRKITPNILGDASYESGLNAYLQQKASADATMNSIQNNPLKPVAQDVNQVSRMLPEEPTQMGSAALLAKRF